MIDITRYRTEQKEEEIHFTGLCRYRTDCRCTVLYQFGRMVDQRLSPKNTIVSQLPLVIDASAQCIPASEEIE